jgi:hypothetical protein
MGDVVIIRSATGRRVLKTIAPVEVTTSLEFQIAAHSRDLSQVLPGANRAFGHASASKPAGEKLRWADQVVLAFGPAPAGTPEEAQVVAEARIVHEALEAISAVGQQVGDQS